MQVENNTNNTSQNDLNRWVAYRENMIVCWNKTCENLDSHNWNCSKIAVVGSLIGTMSGIAIIIGLICYIGLMISASIVGVAASVLNPVTQFLKWKLTKKTVKQFREQVEEDSKRLRRLGESYSDLFHEINRVMNHEQQLHRDTDASTTVLGICGVFTITLRVTTVVLALSTSGEFGSKMASVMHAISTIGIIIDILILAKCAQDIKRNSPLADEIRGIIKTWENDLKSINAADSEFRANQVPVIENNSSPEYNFL